MTFWASAAGGLIGYRVFNGWIPAATPPALGGAVRIRAAAPGGGRVRGLGFHGPSAQLGPPAPKVSLATNGGSLPPRPPWDRCRWGRRLGSSAVRGLGVALYRGRSFRPRGRRGFTRVPRNGRTPVATCLPRSVGPLGGVGRFDGSGLGPSCARSGRTHPPAVAPRSWIGGAGRHERTLAVSGRPASFPAPAFPRLRSGYARSLRPQPGNWASRGCLEPGFIHSP